MKKVIFAVCEGSHDSAFLYKLLSYEGFKTFSKKIGDFPKPISFFLKQSLEAIKYEDLKLDEIRQRPIPGEILFKGETLFLLFAAGGDSKKRLRHDLLKKIQSFAVQPDDKYAEDLREGLTYSLIYFFDADNLGVNDRLKNYENEIEEILGEPPIAWIRKTNSIHNNFQGLNLGCFIIADKNGYGKLENIILPIMEKENENIFREISDFLKLKTDDRLFRLELFNNEEGKLEEKYSCKKQDFDEAKSKIGIAGQLQNSGKSNPVIIKDTDYITLRKVKEHPICLEIIDFIKSISE